MCSKSNRDFNLSVFNRITGINGLKTLKKHISCKSKCKFDRSKCSSNQKWNNSKYWCECKKYNICKKDSVCNPATCSCKNGKYLANIMDNSVITYDDIIKAEVKSYDEETKTILPNFDEKM